MKNNKFFSKKSARYALVAATAALGMASVNTTAQAAIGIPSLTNTLIVLKVNNNTNGCVRVYTKGHQYDIPAHRSANIPAVRHVGYMASAFKYGCGGQALGNRWYTTNNADTQTWNIY